MSIYMEQDFINSFIETALWSSTYEHENCVDCVQGQCNPNCDDGEYELSDTAKGYLTAVAEKAFVKLKKHIKDKNYTGPSQYTPAAMAGHHAWLTSQGHGCGFKDGDWKSKAADKLAKKACTAISEGIYFYVNYQTGLMEIG